MVKNQLSIQGFTAELKCASKGTMTMEERYPIKFTLGQFVILLGVSVVVLSLIFLLGARFGGQIFPEHYAKQFQKGGALAGLAPGKETGQILASKRANLLVDTPEEEEEGEAEEMEEEGQETD
ncbi:MAG: hypothetical protein R3257_01915, partial [bacterium]|nr:hypothetical protein [bacterium]